MTRDSVASLCKNCICFCAVTAAVVFRAIIASGPVIDGLPLLPRVEWVSERLNGAAAVALGTLIALPSAWALSFCVVLMFVGGSSSLLMTAVCDY